MFIVIIIKVLSLWLPELISAIILKEIVFLGCAHKAKGSVLELYSTFHELGFCCQCESCNWLYGLLRWSCSFKYGLIDGLILGSNFGIRMVNTDNYSLEILINIFFTILADCFLSVLILAEMHSKSIPTISGSILISIHEIIWTINRAIPFDSTVICASSNSVLADLKWYQFVLMLHVVITIGVILALHVGIPV